MKQESYHWASMQLFFKLLIPFRIARLIAVLAFTIVLVGILLKWFLDLDWVAAAGKFIFWLIACTILVVLPTQLISLASCRPLTLLVNSRRLLLRVTFIFVLLFSAMFNEIFNSREHWSEFSLLFLVVWLMVSVLLLTGIWICSHWQGGHGLLFVLNVFFVDIARQLAELNPLWLVLAIFGVWLIFAGWWFRWRPTKYQANIYAMSLKDMQAQTSKNRINSFLLSGGADSWLGSRLLGAPDGWSARVKRVIFSFLIILMVLGLLLLTNRNGQLDEHLPYFMMAFTLVALAGGSQMLLASYYKNIKLTWLYLSGNREQIFNYVWRI